MSSSMRLRSRCCAIPPSATRSSARAASPTCWSNFYIKSINDAVAECPADVVIGVHMCRGNFKGHYLGAGGYESVAERFFADTKVNHFLLEYDTPRAGDFAPLRFVPKDKGVVLGRDQLEDAGAGKPRCAQAPRRRSGPLHRSRPAGDRPAMRLCQHGCRQSGHRRRRAPEAVRWLSKRHANSGPEHSLYFRAIRSSHISGVCRRRLRKSSRSSIVPRGRGPRCPQTSWIKNTISSS